MAYIQRAIDFISSVNPNQPEFIQSVEEVFGSLEKELEEHPEYESYRILERLATPERIVKFRVIWENDDGDVEINHGYRVQFHTLLGPGKGGLRFHSSVNASVLSFLAFEQSFKNALTPLSLGSAKGGADFNPDGRSRNEVMRFCQAFMGELQNYIGENADVPAGDINVGAREIGFMFGQYRRLSHRWSGTLTGKGVGWGGSEFRIEATGFGAVEFASQILEDNDEELDGLDVVVSGAGNVALHAAEELIVRGARVLTLSDSRGTVHFPDGLDEETLASVKKVKIDDGGHLSDVELPKSAEYMEGEKPWGIACTLAMPCATQNEVNGEESEALIEKGVKYVVEGANMPCTPDAISKLRDAGVIIGPGKAANAGGVVVSGFEMRQNASFESWSRETVKKRLQDTMGGIYRKCRETAHDLDVPNDLVVGANVAGFRRLAQAAIAQGYV